MRAALLDCGPMVALLDAADARHEWTVKRAGELRWKLATTGPVITEAMFLLQDAEGGVESLTGLIRELRVEVMDVFDLASLEMASRLMGKYRNVPMDFADATLVIAAERLGLAEILTLDERGFRTYRFGGNRGFTLVLQDWAESQATD